MKINKINTSSLITYLILAADIGLFIRIGIVKPYTVQLYEFFILLAGAVFIIYSFLFGFDKKFLFILKKYGQILPLILMCLSTGLILGAWNYGLSREIIILLIKDLFLIITVFIGFILHIYYNNEVFQKKVMYCLSFGVILSPFILFPTLAEKWNLIGNSFSLIGLHSNQNILATYLLIPVSFFSGLFFFKEKRTSIKIIFWMLTILSLSLMIWTGSRSSWIAVVFLFTLYTFEYVKMKIGLKKKILYFLAISCFVLLSALTSFAILSHTIKIMALDRIFPTITNNKPSVEVLENTTITKSLETINSNPPSVLTYQNRQNIWPQSISLAFKNPLGLGPEYANMSKSITEPDGRFVASHNTFLQSLLSGGIILLLLVIFSIFYVTKALIYITRENQNKKYLIGIWISFMIIIIFNDLLFSIPWLWIVAGIILGEKERVLND